MAGIDLDELKRNKQGTTAHDELIEVAEKRIIKKKFTMDIDEDIHWIVKKFAMENRTTMGEVIDKAIREYLRKNGAL